MPVTAEQFENFRVKLQGLLDDYYGKNFANSSVPTIVLMPGRKMVRIVRQGPGERSAYGFIDAETGDLLKAAGWSQPAKHKRGNILGENPIAGCGPYGVAYLR